MSMELLLPLELLRRGEWGEITEVQGEPAWIARMAELGLRPGSPVQVVQPGIPCLVRLGNSRLSLRGEDAMQILVRPAATGDAMALRTAVGS